MITGKKDIDSYFDQYVKEWSQAGGDRLLKEGNDWYQQNAAK